MGPDDDFNFDAWLTTTDAFGAEMTTEPFIGEGPEGEVAPTSDNPLQIIGFYNNRANAVKAARHINITKHDYRNGDVNAPVVIKTLTNIEAFDPDIDKTITETFVNGVGTSNTTRRLNDFMPVNGTPYVSRLQPAYVQKATCVQQKDGWVIQINLNNEHLNLDTLRKNAGGVKNIAEVDQNTLINGVLFKTAYGSCMDMGISELFLGNGTDSTQRFNFDLNTVGATGTLSEGKIIAHVNLAGNMDALTLSFKINIEITYMKMKIKINAIAKQDYQLVWPGAAPGAR